MSYTLITRNGTVMQFYLKSVAEMYQTINGGTVITADILVDNTAETQYNTL